MFGRLVGYADIKEAERLCHDPATRWIVDGKATWVRAASPGPMGRTILIFNSRHPLTSHDGQTPDQACFNQLPTLTVATSQKRIFTSETTADCSNNPSHLSTNYDQALQLQSEVAGRRIDTTGAEHRRWTTESATAMAARIQHIPNIAGAVQRQTDSVPTTLKPDEPSRNSRDICKNTVFDFPVDAGLTDGSPHHNPAQQVLS